MSKPKDSKTTAKKATIDAIELLKADHRQVEELFADFEAAEDEEKNSIAQAICRELTVHAQIEEEILYPAAKEALEDDDKDMVNEAAVEHATAKDLIAQIEGMTVEDEPFNATVKVLSEYIKHHVKEEEKELFPALKDTELDLEDIGSQLAARKAELLAELAEESEDQASLDDSGDAEEGDEEEQRPAAKKRSNRVAAQTKNQSWSCS
jgi:Hemerythrin HHE cation binding domain.